MAIRQLLALKTSATPPPATENPNGDLSIQYPFANDTVTGYAKVYAKSPTATSVDFYIDNVQVSNNYTYRPNNPDLSTDQSTYWINDGVNAGALSNGTHTLKVVAHYSNGTTTTKTRTITVSSPSSLPSLPTSSAASATLINNESVTYAISKDGNGNEQYETINNFDYYDQTIHLASGTTYDDYIRILVPTAVYNNPQATPTPVVWFFHGAGSDHNTVSPSGGHNYHAQIAVANGAIAISCKLGGTLYTHPTAQRTLRNAYVYMANRFNISASFLRGTSHGGSLSTLAYGRDLIPNIRGLFVGIGVYDIEDNTGNSASVGVWADPDDFSTSTRLTLQASGQYDDMIASSVHTAFNGNLTLAGQHNPARLSRFDFTGKNIQLFADGNPTPTLAGYANGDPGDHIVDFQYHANMFRQNITLHGAPLPEYFGLGSDSDNGHTESGIPDFTLTYAVMVKDFIDNA